MLLNQKPLSPSLPEIAKDEYVEGRTFLAKARGKAFNADSLHEYLVFGGGACIGKEEK